MQLIASFTNSQESRIYDGYAIDISEAPYMAQVYFVDEKSFEHRCGGAILREDIVITAGHCVRDSHTLEDRDANGFTVMVGATKRHDHKMGQTLKVQNVYPHPDFKGHKGGLHHDVGILRLASKIVMGETTESIKLALSSDEPPIGRKIITSGWGRNPQHPKDKGLYQAIMAISSYRECAKRYNQNIEELKKHEICARPVQGKTCPGDSGGPAIDTETNRLIGLTSFGKGGCDVNHAVVFVKMTDNLDFVNSIISQNGTNDSSVESDDGCDAPSLEEH
ncbi:hypothetical protein HA402_009231 [Bradysia odoriphaga]|nr:hypothetical protein HA402_009231 [Bradysia odoriphaga]